MPLNSALWQWHYRPFFADARGLAEMLLDIGTNFRAAVRGEEQTAEYSQFGLLWQQEFERLPHLKLAAAFSHIDENDTLLGGKFGGAMPLTADKFAKPILAQHFPLAILRRRKMAGVCQYQDIDAHFGGIVGEVSGLAAEGWRGTGCVWRFFPFGREKSRRYDITTLREKTYSQSRLSCVRKRHRPKQYGFAPGENSRLFRFNMHYQ